MKTRITLLVAMATLLAGIASAETFNNVPVVDVTCASKVKANPDAHPRECALKCQNPTISLEDDVAVTRRVLARQNGPAILVGHSYGGAVITEAGNDPKVAALVYIAAFAPDSGESVATLIKGPTPDASVSPMLPPQDGFLFLDKAKFASSYAADVDPEKAAFWADSQVQWGVACLSEAIREPAWRTKPSWYLVATDDKRIPPDLQRAMAKRAGSIVVEAKGSHAIYFSQPKAVAALIEQVASKDKGSAVA